MANTPSLVELVDARDRLLVQHKQHEHDSMRALLRHLHRCRPRMKDLAVSQLGRLVSQLAKDNALPPQVRVHAEVLLAQWKRFAAEEGIAPPKQGRSDEEKENTAPNSKASPPVKAQGVHQHRHRPYPQPLHAVAPPPADREPTAGTSQVHLYEEPGRNVIVRRLLEVLSLPLPAGTTPATVDVLEVAKEIEEELHATFSQEHDPENKLLRFGQLRSNLHDNCDLRAAVLCGETPPKKLVHMKAWELGKWEARQNAQLQAKNGAIKSE
eukprot:GGOE01006039.1.p1 GENE.GGOE01006039.1~~GGOE01006039.1.p1  ORF type:complete len:268 (+),score=84.88 GGOE01006039.1:31-834(+)